MGISIEAFIVFTIKLNPRPTLISSTVRARDGNSFLYHTASFGTGFTTEKEATFLLGNF